jgi:putative ABC transport system ATP-binding protein
MVERIIEARNIAKSYEIDGRTISVLSGIDLDIDYGEFVVVAGASGSGKTTLLSLLSGLDCPSMIWHRYAMHSPVLSFRPFT